MTAYFLFVGSSPAVQRAWIVSSLVLIGKLLRRPTAPLNLLGAALFIELAFDPLIAANLGFQLSFGCCFGILLLYQPIEKALSSLLPQRPLSKSVRLSPVSLFLFLASTSLRSALAITFAVNAATLPLLFYHFGRFPLLSLLYNLFFPLFISFDLFILMTALLVHVLAPFLASPLFFFLDWFTAQLLEMVAYPPLLLDYSLYCPEFPLFLIPIYLFGLFAYSIRFQKTGENIYF
jgi:competence protein ComEC